MKTAKTKRSWLTTNRFSGALLACLGIAVSAPSQSIELPGWLGGHGDSGSGKVAHLEFHLDDGFYPTSLAWSPDGRFIASAGTHTRKLHIWDVTTQKMVQDLVFPNPPSASYHNLAWSPDGRYLVACNSFDSSLRIYDTSDWHVFKDFDRDTVGCAKPVFSSDGQELAVLGGDLTRLSTKDWTVVRQMKGTVPATRDRPPVPGWNWRVGANVYMAYLPGSRTVVIGGGQLEKQDTCGKGVNPKTGRLWLLDPDENVLGRNIVVYCSPTGSDVTFFAISPDGDRVATATRTGNGQGDYTVTDSIRIIDLKSGQALAAPLDNISHSNTQGISFTPDGRYLISSDSTLNHPAIYILDGKSYKRLDTLHANEAVLDLVVHPQSTQFAVASGNGVTVWNLMPR